MSDTETAAPIDLTAEVSVPDGEVSREDLVKILEDSRKAEPVEDAAVTATPAKPVEPPKDPKADTVSARILASRKAELRATEERKAIAAERAEAEKLKAEAAEHVKVVEAVKAAKLSPSKAMELMGYKHPKDFLEALATEYEPEVVAKRAIEGTQSELEKLKAELAAEREAQVKARQEQEQARFKSDYDAVTHKFVQFVDSAPQKYPHLHAEHTLAEIAQMGRSAAEQHAVAYKAKFGEYPDDEVIADYLESQAKARASALAERRARIGLSPSTPSQGAAAIQGQPSQATTPRTLTNGASSQRSTAPRVAMTQAEMDAESKRILDEMYASMAANKT